MPKSIYAFSSRVQWRLPTSLLAALFLYVPLLSRYALNAADDAGLPAHSRAFYWLLASGIFMGGHIPERFARGAFDLIGYGHQIFHVCVTYVAHNLLIAANADLAALQRDYAGQALNTGWDMVAAMAALVTINVITMWYLVRTANTKHA